MLKEIKEINGKYSVSDEGYIINNKSGKILKGQCKSAGQLQVTLCINRHNFLHKYISNLVAQYFLPIPKELKNSTNLEVRHLDGNKTNNNVSNLQWVEKGFGRKHNEKGILCFRTIIGVNIYTNEKVQFNSYISAARYLYDNISYYNKLFKTGRQLERVAQNIRISIGKNKEQYGFIWSVTKEFPLSRKREKENLSKIEKGGD